MKSYFVSLLFEVFRNLDVFSSAGFIYIQIEQQSVNALDFNYFNGISIITFCLVISQTDCL